MSSDLDQLIGSYLEAWLTRDTGDWCRFCNEPVGDDGPEEFCDEHCEQQFAKVREARLAIGQRDLRQRGYD